MRTTWEALRRQLERSTQTLGAQHAFRRAATARPALARFAEPDAVVAFLHGHDDDLDQKDRVLCELVRWARGHENQVLAANLLWLGLWPALDRIYRHRRRDVASQREAVSLISTAFTETIERVNLPRCGRLAATLVRNTKRGVTEQLGREQLYRYRMCAAGPANRPGVRTEPQPQSVFENAVPTDAAAVLRSVYEWMQSLTGPDADLFFAVHVLGEPQAEAGRRLDLSHTATRKRLERARKILHGQLSHLGVEARVSPVKATRSPRRR